MSRFFGVVIRMFYNDHPVPHFHEEYAEHKARYAIATLAVLSGALPQRAHAFVLEWAWAWQHRDELLADWTLARAGTPLVAVAPLK